MSAVEQANKVMESMGWQPRIGCSCGGYWWYEHGEARGATHAQGCPRADAPPPSIPRAVLHPGDVEVVVDDATGNVVGFRAGAANSQERP